MNLQSDEEGNIGGSKKYEIRGVLDLSWHFYFIDTLRSILWCDDI